MPSLYSPEKKTVGNLLSNTSPPIVVPDWQRNYSWTTSEIETFWSDLIAFDQKYPNQNINDQEYFLGSIVIVNKNVSHELLDGQQRVATSAILLSVVRDYFERFNRDSGTRLSARFLRDYDDAQDRSVDRLTLNAYDREFFRREILETRNPQYQAPAPELESHRKIRAARNYFASKFEEQYQRLTPPQAHAWAVRISLVFTNHISVVAVISDDEDNASEVFETLNDRGIGLSTPDLLRNLLLRRAKEDDRQSIVNQWGEILSMETEASDVKMFIRHFWLARAGDVKSQALYREIKRKIEADNTDSLVFTIEIRDAATLYRDLVSAHDESEDVAKLLVDVRELGAFVLYPPLLSGFTRFSSPRERAILTQALISTYVRHSVICGRENSRLETILFSLAKDITNGSTLEDVLMRLSQFAPSNDDFLNSFRVAQVQRRATARYLLRKLEMVRHVDPEFALLSPNKVHVEHIYPQSPPDTRRWPEHDDMINRLGNLTLLARRLNVEARNAAFVDKLPSYKSSRISMTQELLDLPEWTPQRLADRQANMSELALEVWRLPASVQEFHS